MESMVECMESMVEYMEQKHSTWNPPGMWGQGKVLGLGQTPFLHHGKWSLVKGVGIQAAQSS